MFLAIYLEFATFSERNFEVGRLAVSVPSKLLQIFARCPRSYYKFFIYTPPGSARTTPSISNIVSSEATSS